MESEDFMIEPKVDLSYWKNISSPSSHDISVVFIIDNAYLMPLAVAIRSLLNHFCCDSGHFGIAGQQNAWKRSLTIYIIGIALTENDKHLLKRIVSSFAVTRPSLVEHSIPNLVFIDLPPGTCPLMTKLTLPQLLPESLSKVLYLDADILVRADIGSLWGSPTVFNTKTIAGIVDVGVASSNYFNAGVLVMNLDFMRMKGLSEKMLAYVKESEEGLSRFPLKEQDVLNKFFAPKPDGCGWEALSLYWNAQGLDSFANFRVSDSKSSDLSLFTRDSLNDLKQNAYIVHFTGSSRIELSNFNMHCPMPTKPWSSLVFTPNDGNSKTMLNPYVHEWFSVLYSIDDYQSWLPWVNESNKIEATSLGRLYAELEEKLSKQHEVITQLRDECISQSMTYPLSHGGKKENDKIAILLPITSKGVKDIDTQLQALKILATSFPALMTKFYVGIDDNDDHYCQSGSSRHRLLQAFTSVGRDIAIMDFPVTTPPKICSIVRALARQAYEESDDNFYFILLGDDVLIRTPVDEILPYLRESFSAISHRLTNVPYGFGCVAFQDETSLGFPTFPVVTRIHMTIFDGEWCPDIFINQDADPYLYELYRKFQASSFSRRLILRNTIGGADSDTGNKQAQQETRYVKQHIDWQNELLQESAQQIVNYVTSSPSMMPSLKPCIRLDIIVPSYRIQRDYLQRIIDLPVPPNCSTTVIVILDNPHDPVSFALKDEFEAIYRDKVRIRVNHENKGASYSRSRGLNESCADWILFLDDDVIPSPNLLYVYCEEIARTGHRYAGYVGATHMPDYRDTRIEAATSIYTKGIQLVHLLHFWADHVSASDRELAPWGITAQLCIRRLKEQRFNEVFPKTGGGEDIDLCLRTCHQLKLSLKNLPAARCLHPWWNNGQVAISRFYGWAKGDALLVDLYPEHCYRSYPNGLEVMLLLIIIFVLILPFSMTQLCSEPFNGFGIEAPSAVSCVFSLAKSLLVVSFMDIGFEAHLLAL